MAVLMGGAYGCEVKVAVMAARVAGTCIAKSYRKTHCIDFKGTGDLVCEVDRRSEEKIIGVIGEAFPDDAIISEESYDGSTLAAGAGRSWIVDPIDGSSSYIFHVGENLPSTIIALQENGRTQAGVIYFPLTGELFVAVRGEGAWYGQFGSVEAGEKPGVEELDGELVPVQVPERPIGLKDSWVEMNRNNDASLSSDGFNRLDLLLRSERGAALVTTQAPHSGIAARIARGVGAPAAVVHDNHPVQVKQAVWDVLAAALILEEAGGYVCNLAGAPYDPFVPEAFLMARSVEIGREIVELLA